MSRTPSLSVVLPCFNEGPRIAESLATLDLWLGATAEVLVIDDGSIDDSAGHVTSFASAHPNVRVHAQPRNMGKGAAIRAAIPLVRGDYVILMDADLAYDRDSIYRVVNALAWADIAVGNRRHPLSRYSVPVSLFGFLYRRHLVGQAFNIFVRALLHVSLPDTQCGLKGFRREALERIGPLLTADGFAIDVEMLLAARTLGLRLTDVPVHVTYHSAKSSVKLMRSGVSMALEVLRMAAGSSARSRQMRTTQAEKESAR
jgi:glycosyltransferase involved in cell wall biosynthesis